MRRTFLTAVLAASILLAGCGGGDDEGDAAVGDAPFDVPSDSTAGPGGAGIEGAGEFPTVALGTAQESRGGSITVRSVKCGLAELANGASNPKWDGGDDIPQYVPVKAEPGMEFCRVSATWEVTGPKPVVGWHDFQNLITADGTEYAADDVADEATQSINRVAVGCAPTLCGELNPGKKINVVKIYQVPAGTKPVAVVWPMDMFIENQQWRFTLDEGSA